MLNDSTMLWMMALQGCPGGLRELTRRVCGNQAVLGVPWLVLLHFWGVLHGVMLPLCREVHEHWLSTLQDLDTMLLLGRIGI